MYAWRGRADANAPFIFALIVAGWVALNQQILTGRFVQYGHYYWYFIVPISIIISIYMLWKIAPRRVGTWGALALIAIAFMNTAVGQYRSFPTSFQNKLREQDFAPILMRLNALPRGTVFMGASSDTYPFLITIYTHDDLYWLPAAASFAFPEHRPEEALLLHLYMDARARKHPTVFLERELEERRADTYTELYSEIEGWHSGLDYYDYQKRKTHAASDPALASLRVNLLQEIAAQYQKAFASHTSARALLAERGVRYILWDKRQYPDWDLTSLKPLTLLATSTDLELYQLP